MLKKGLTVVIVFLLCSRLANAQAGDTPHTITFKRSLIPSRKFYLDDNRVSLRQVKLLLNENPASAKQFQKSKRLKTQGIVFYSASAVMVTSVAIKILTYETGDAIFSSVLGTKPEHYKPTGFETTVLAGGSALMIFSAVQYFKGEAALKKAISAYNNSYGAKQKVSVHACITNTGNVGLVVNF